MGAAKRPGGDRPFDLVLLLLLLLPIVRLGIPSLPSIRYSVQKIHNHSPSLPPT